MESFITKEELDLDNFENPDDLELDEDNLDWSPGIGNEDSDFDPLHVESDASYDEFNNDDQRTKSGKRKGSKKVNSTPPTKRRKLRKPNYVEESSFDDTHYASGSRLKKQKSRRKFNLPYSWCDGSVYDCPTCHYHHRSPQVIFMHLKNKHGESGKSDGFVNLAMYRAESRTFQCALCQDSFLCERPLIIFHLANIHDMTLEVYEETFASTDILVESEEDEEVESSAFQQQKAITMKFKGHLKFQCHICGVELLHMRNIIDDHLKNQHHITYDAYNIKFGSKKSSAVRDVSKESPKKEIDSTDENNRWFNGSKFMCPFCEKVFHNRDTIRSHMMARYKGKYEEKYSNFIIEKSDYTCKICQRSVLQEKRSISLHLSRMHDLTIKDYEDMYHQGERPKTKYAWTHGLVHTCPFCKFEANERELLRNHMKSKHKGEFKEPFKYTTCISLKQKFKCHICQRPILFERRSISGHLQSQHQMSLAEYEEKFPQVKEYAGRMGNVAVQFDVNQEEDGVISSANEEDTNKADNDQEIKDE